MPDLKVVKFQRGGIEYKLICSWNDEALMEGDVSIEIEASRYPIDDPDRSSNISASVSIISDEEERPVLQIKVEDWSTTIPLEELYGDTWIEGILESIPPYIIPADPIMVCLTRSGVSTSIGQLIDCKNNTIEAQWFWRRAREIGKCLRENIPEMCTKMAFRCGRCVASYM